jgi:hypothetical protein
MDDSQKRKSRLELGHVLFIDTAGYSTLKMTHGTPVEVTKALDSLWGGKGINQLSFNSR